MLSVSMLKRAKSGQRNHRPLRKEPDALAEIEALEDQTGKKRGEVAVLPPSHPGDRPLSGLTPTYTTRTARRHPDPGHGGKKAWGDGREP